MRLPFAGNCGLRFWTPVKATARWQSSAPYRTAAYPPTHLGAGQVLFCHRTAATTRPYRSVSVWRHLIGRPSMSRRRCSVLANGSPACEHGRYGGALEVPVSSIDASLTRVALRSEAYRHRLLSDVRRKRPTSSPLRRPRWSRRGFATALDLGRWLRVVAPEG